MSGALSNLNVNAALGRMGYYREMQLAHLIRKDSGRFSHTKSKNTELLAGPLQEDFVK